eukprot:scaffold8881_cov95-Isochrysis_galbana.AAC.5
MGRGVQRGVRDGVCAVCVIQHVSVERRVAVGVIQRRRDRITSQCPLVAIGVLAHDTERTAHASPATTKSAADSHAEARTCGGSLSCARRLLSRRIPDSHSCRTLPARGHRPTAPRRCNCVGFNFSGLSWPPPADASEVVMVSARAKEGEERRSTERPRRRKKPWSMGVRHGRSTTQQQENAGGATSRNNTA